MSNIYQNNITTYQKLLEPIIFLDLFEYPLTLFEIWNYSDKYFSFLETENKVQDLVENDILQKKDGFYFLPNRKSLVKERNRKYNYSTYKLKKAKKFAKLFSFFPGVKAVAAANFIGGHNWRLGSDIDIFIITKPGWIWRSRFFCAGVSKILNSRPTKLSKKDKICLSFYVSEDFDDMDKLKISGEDPYFDFWLKGLLFLEGDKNAWDSFWSSDKSEISRTKKKMSLLELLAKNIQLKVMPKYLYEAMNNSHGVVVNDQILKLYLKDKRKYFREKFNLAKHEIFKTIN